MNRELSTDKKQLSIAQCEWDKLIKSIPPKWVDRLLLGNQNIKNKEWLALPIDNEIADVYCYVNGMLCYYERDEDDDTILVPTIQSGSPGDNDVAGDYPNLNQLKRIRICQDGNSYKIVSWSLPDYKKDCINYGGISSKMFIHTLGNKAWRLSLSTRHIHICEFTQKVFNDREYDLTNVMKTLAKIPIPEKHRDIIYKIINKGLYIGEVANKYQIHCKGVKLDSPILTPEFCVYSKHQYTVGFYPKTHKIVSTNVLDYDYAFWGSPIAKGLWAECLYVTSNISDSIEQQVNLNDWTDIFKLLDVKYKTLDINSIIKISFIIATIDTIYNTYKMLTDEYINDKITDYFIDNLITIAISRLHEQYTMIIYLLPAIDRFLFINQTAGYGTKVFTEREKAYIPEMKFDNNKLDKNQIKLYKTYFNKSKFVEVDNRKLVIKPFRREPP